MRKVKFRNWEFEVDLESTQKSFANELNVFPILAIVNIAKTFVNKEKILSLKKLKFYLKN